MTHQLLPVIRKLLQKAVFWRESSFRGLVPAVFSLRRPPASLPLPVRGVVRQFLSLDWPSGVSEHSRAVSGADHTVGLGAAVTQDSPLPSAGRASLSGSAEALSLESCCLGASLPSRIGGGDGIALDHRGTAGEGQKDTQVSARPWGTPGPSAPQPPRAFPFSPDSRSGCRAPTTRCSRTSGAWACPWWSCP